MPRQIRCDPGRQATITPTGANSALVGVLSLVPGLSRGGPGNPGSRISGEPRTCSLRCPYFCVVDSTCKLSGCLLGVFLRLILRL